MDIIHCRVRKTVNAVLLALPMTTYTNTGDRCQLVRDRRYQRFRKPDVRRSTDYIPVGNCQSEARLYVSSNRLSVSCDSCVD